MSTHVSNEAAADVNKSKETENVVVNTHPASSDGDTGSERDREGAIIPLRMKIIAVLLVTAVGFGSHWSSGVTGAMKSTLKKVCI